MLKWKPKVKFEKGVEILLKNINLWKKAPLPVNEIVALDKDGFGKNPADVLGTRNDVTDEKFYDFSKKMVGKGATILGGCCETKPYHINAISKLKQI